MEQFFELYGTTHWTYSTAESYASLNRRFVRPLLGALRIDGLTGLDMAMLYRHLTNGTKSQPPICSSTLRDLHKLLKCAFHQAILWGVLERSPLDGIVLPKQKRLKKPTWNEEQVRQAVRACGNDIPLSLAIQFAFACSLRMGELLALRWSDIDFEQNTVRINKTMQRINRSALSFIGTKDIIEALPSENNNSPTLLVIKAPKTQSSIRTAFLPEQLSKQLQSCKKQIHCESTDSVFRLRNGKPLQPEGLRKRFRALIDKTDLPKVTFHSLRHSSVTYKLVLTHGNIKAVQGDTGHAQASMVLEVYAEILDAERKKTAALLGRDWYGADC